MANKNRLNKNSVYVQSLVDFLLDTKPYHSKLTEIVEEYRFYDDINVDIKERFSSKMKISPTTMFNYFSSATPLYRVMPAKRMVSPSFSLEMYKAGLEENTDLALVPFVYGKKAGTNTGANTVNIRRKGFVEPLTESVDYFQSNGAFQFQIKQIRDAHGDFSPLWANTIDDNVIVESTLATQHQALDRSNPSSSWNKIRAILNEIQVAVNSIHGHADVQRELDLLYAILDSDTLPRSYEALLAWLGVPNDNGILVQLSEKHDREWLEVQFTALTPPLFFNMFTDIGVRESGLTDYANTRSSYISVENISLKFDGDVQEWTLQTFEEDNTLYSVVGSVSGPVGFIKAGDSFDNGHISFITKKLATPVGSDSVTLTPTRKIVISPNAALETWNIIKTNPIAHNRPQFTSARYGYLTYVVVLDQTMPTCDLILTARGDGFFDLTSTAEPSYKGVAEVGKAFNDGRIVFLISKGTRSFIKNERFYITIENQPASPINLDLGFGFDVDPYDDDISTYPTNETLGFYFDGRFTDYDLSRLNLKISQTAKDARQWRARAVPNMSRQIGSYPDPLNADGSLQVYHADHFVLEYSDDNFLTPAVYVSDIEIGGTYSSEIYGIHFSIPPASRPFIAVSAYNNADPRVISGDILSFSVSNPLPRVIETSASSVHFPRLIMHSGDFYDAPEAHWIVEFTKDNIFNVTALNSGVIIVPTISCSIDTAGRNVNEGFSFKGSGIHFTIMPGDGVSTGDVFTFETYAQKPSYLVHGSVSGWTEPATVGKFYWNGKIGFKINPPVAQTYVNGISTDLGLKLNVREDCPSVTYTFTRTPAGFIVTRSDTGETNFVSLNGIFKDKWLSTRVTATADFTIFINSHDYPLWNSADVIIINPESQGRLPNFGETIVIEKTKESRLDLNLVSADVDLSPLSPITIDQRFIGITTQGIPLSSTSPETSLLQGWIPLTTQKLDSATSTAEFFDPTTSYVFTSSATNEKVGVLKQQSTGVNEPIVFEWDQNFYMKYLPLNAEANIVISDTGWNENTRVRITESVKFLISGGALVEDWMFHDDITVKVTEKNFISLAAKWHDSFSTIVKDGPFGGFLPGYGNMPYDAEKSSETASYDPGLPLDLQSLLMKRNITDAEKQDILDLWGNFLQSSAVPVTEEQLNFVQRALLDDPTANWIAHDIGFPLIGKAIDIIDRPTGNAVTKFTETMVIQAADRANLLESNLFDEGFMDSRDESTAIINYVGELPPPRTEVPQNSSYELFDTPMTITVPTRIFEISFKGSREQLSALAPKFLLWTPNDAAPVPVKVVERVGLGVFRFMLARPTKGKIIVG
ncbi:hypothetical protein [Acinetobacter sp.]|uniref:hypothetical protein n=1 Tax=Acinetobacter sp. TaxID=472 RepID=UPI00388EABD6